MPVLPRFDLGGLAADAERFARAFPAVAASLGRTIADPSTERLVGSAYYLAGTLLDKVKDFQTSAHELVAQRAAPWLQRPIPSATVVSFEASRSGWLPVPTTEALASVPIEGAACTFRLLAPFTLAPYAVREASVRCRPGAASVLELVIEGTGDEPVNEAIRGGVSLYIDGDLEQALSTVHALTSAVARVEVMSRTWSRPVVASAPVITREGLTPEEALAPDPDGPPAPFGVVTEALLFPHKFRFVRVRGLEGCADAAPTNEVRVSVTFRSDVSLGPLGAQDVRTNCAPAVNLFEAFADPLPIAFERGPMAVRVAGLPRRAGRVYAIREAWAAASGERPRPVPDLRRLSATTISDAYATFATSLLRTSEGDPELSVAFAPSTGAQAEGRPRIASLRVLATNGVFAERVRAGDVSGQLQLGAASVAFRNVVAASRYVPPPADGSFALRVVRSAGVRRGVGEALAGLREALFLNVPSWLSDREAVRAMHQRIEGIQGVDVEVARRTGPRGGTERGYGYRLRVDESSFRGVGDLDLTAAVIAEALARCAPVNTFVELSVAGTKTGVRLNHAPSRPA
jgi:type VI secretion system protein ImpG